MTRNTVAASALEACHGAAAQRTASAWATAGACPGGGCGRPVACNRGLAAKAALAPGAAWVTAVPDPHPASSTPALAIPISRARVSGTGSPSCDCGHRCRLRAALITIRRASDNQHEPEEIPWIVLLVPSAMAEILSFMLVPFGHDQFCKFLGAAPPAHACVWLPAGQDLLT